MGIKLSEVLLENGLDPTFQNSNGQQKQDSDTDVFDLIQFRASKKFEAVLPGDNYYLHFDCPRLPGELELLQQNKLLYGRDLTIDRPAGLFRIHLDPKGYIMSLTYIGTERIPTENMLCLYGLHEKYLNRLVARFEEGVIFDFVKFLNETWALPIYHDRFPDFIKSTREAALKKETSAEMKGIIDHLKHQSTRDKMMMEREKKLLYKVFDESSDRKEWDKRTFEFLLDTQVFKSYP